jgi:endogenous inhibitor of DNA gyrase (YacG/DUF329 family)
MSERETKRKPGKTPTRDGSQRCPICGRPSVEKYRPFCTSRCADVDLGRWLKGNYAIPTEEAPDEGSDAEEDES